MPSKPRVPTWGREWESFIIIVQRGSLHGHSSDGWAVRQVGISINLRSSWSGICLFVGSIPSLIINLSHLREFQFLQNNSKILLCVFIDGESGPCPKAALDCLSLVLHPLAWLTAACLSPLELREAHGSWVKGVSCNQRDRRRKALSPGAPQGPAQYQCGSS